jgi:hypothetical protein
MAKSADITTKTQLGPGILRIFKAIKARSQVITNTNTGK